MTSVVTHRFGEHFTVRVVPVLKDNYSYVVRCLRSGMLAAVDVSQPEPVIAALSEERGGVPPSAKDFMVLTTHKHADHSGGNKTLAANFAGLEIHGGAHDHIPAATVQHQDRDGFRLGDLEVRVRHTPCHTKGHVIYHVYHPDAAEAGAVFTGDTMFVGGIGAFFEGDAAMMVDALRCIGDLPPPTRVFPGHEYTMGFMDFAATVEPANPTLKEWRDKFAALREERKPAVASTLEAERAGLNPFMRAAYGDAAIKAATKADDPVAMMQKLYDTCP